MLAINQLIKIVIGVVVIAVVVMGLYFFGSYISDFFGNFAGGEEEKQENVVVTKKSVENKEEFSCESCGYLCTETKCNGISGNCNFKEEGVASFIPFTNYGTCKLK